MCAVGQIKLANGAQTKMKKLLYSLIVITLLVTACSGQAATATPKPGQTPSPTGTPLPPTATPQPTDTPAPTATPTPAPSATATPKPTKIPIERITHIAYIDEVDNSRWLDIYLPAGQDGPFPTILVIPRLQQHKAAWSDYGHYFARQGYAVLVTSRKMPIPDYTYPWYIKDAFCALAWLHTSANVYGFDAEHVFVTGFWSGAGEAALIGTVDNPADYLIDCPHTLPETGWVHGTMMIGGAFDYTHQAFRDGGDPTVPQRFGGSYEEAKELWEAGSPVTWADSNDPPLLYVCGQDTQSTVYYWGNTISDVLADIEPTIKQTGINATIVLLPDLDAFSFISEQIYTVMEEFMTQNLD